MVKPTVKSGFVEDVTFTFIIRMKGKTPGCRSRSSSLASEGSVWQPGVSACAGFEARRPAISIAARVSRLSHNGWPGAALRRLIAEVVEGSTGVEGDMASRIFDVVVSSPALAGAPSSFFVDDVPSAFVGTVPSVFAFAGCFRALKQSTRWRVVRSRDNERPLLSWPHQQFRYLRSLGYTMRQKLFRSTRRESDREMVSCAGLPRERAAVSQLRRGRTVSAFLNEHRSCVRLTDTYMNCNAAMGSETSAAVAQG